MRERKTRQQSQLFCVEGVRLCGELIKHSLPVQRCYLTRSSMQQEPELAQQLQQTASECFLISEDLAQKISGTVNGQGIICVCPLLDNIDYAVKICNDSRYLVLSSLQDPGNVGTMIRTTAAFGMEGIILSADCPDVYNPKVLRSAMGGVFALPIHICEDISTVLGVFAEQGVPTFAAALRRDAIPLSVTDFSRGGAVVIGNEGSGLSDAVIQSCRHTIQIPIVPDAESLNASAAASIILWEMFKQSGKMPG